MSDDLIITMRLPVPHEPGAVQIIKHHVPLRPLFAAAAMNGLLASGIQGHLSYDALADIAARHADAQLKRLEEKPKAGEVQNAN